MQRREIQAFKEDLSDSAKEVGVTNSASFDQVDDSGSVSSSESIEALLPCDEKSVVK
jgi:hypothetical protein